MSLDPAPRYRPALYRIYRPALLSEVIGQEHVTGPLGRALESGQLHHAFLFSGPRGCGKTSTARILARSMLCERGPTPDPCGECQFCVALAPNGPGLIDVIELDAASHGGVDDTRDLRERAAFVPAQARFKVYIIDEAHMVTKDGFNALLKLIEEPPDHLKFIFATTEVEKVIPTIRSRTFNYAFRLVSDREIQENLAMICDAESVEYDAGALMLIARAGGGSVRDAQSILGQLIAGASGKPLLQSEVAEQLGVTDEALLDAVVECLADQDGAGLFAVIDKVISSGHDVRRFVTDLLHRFRDLLVLCHAGSNPDLLDVSNDRLDTLSHQAGRFSQQELSWLCDQVNQGLSHVKGSTSPRLQLEILAAKLLLPAAAGDDALASRVATVERRLAALGSGAIHVTPASAAPPTVAAPPSVAPSAPSAVGPPASAAPPARGARESAGPPPPPRLTTVREARTPQEEPEPSEAPTAASSAELSVESVRRIWQELMQQVATSSRVAAAMWEGSEPVAIEDGHLVVRVPTAGHAASIRQSNRDGQLRTLLITNFEIDLVVRAAAADSEADAPADGDPDLPASDLGGVDLAVRELGATKVSETRSR
ncbi:MAG: DNA polymerase III subunit gamma/tau [Candidatus Nanopelagicales bacterium]|nr:DNA polymerase III subunit gamma/tau [Candidatus Nanopelagicales bacterium]MDZ4250191.1 DNA polymerase III subunit gamma/tau [Candidatus Nanopelagicales bacterium]